MTLWWNAVGGKVCLGHQPLRLPWRQQCLPRLDLTFTWSLTNVPFPDTPCKCMCFCACSSILVHILLESFVCCYIIKLEETLCGRWNSKDHQRNHKFFNGRVYLVNHTKIVLILFILKPIFGKEYLCLILQFCFSIAYQYLTRLYRSMCCLIRTILIHRTKEVIFIVAILS